LLLGLFALVSPAWSHPDLLLQIENLDARLLAEPGNAELLTLRGDLYRRHADYAAAARDFAAARVIQPEYPLLDFHEGQLLLETGDPGAAEQHLDRYLLLHPQHAGAWILRAEIHLAQGEAEAAARDYAMAIGHADHASPALYRDWALALVAAGMTQWNPARNVVDIALEQFPRDVSLLALGADIALAENQPDLATSYFDRLPEPMMRLPSWQARSEAMNCLESQATEAAESGCLAAARKALEEQASPLHD
jgi:predicted Zn-dependent protease